MMGLGVSRAQAQRLLGGRPRQFRYQANHFNLKAAQPQQLNKPQCSAGFAF
jgi:hypothetical protein